MDISVFVKHDRLTGTISILFVTYFTVRFRRTFVIILSLKIPPHPKCVATLPCEMSVFSKQQLKKDDFSNNTF